MDRNASRPPEFPPLKADSRRATLRRDAITQASRCARDRTSETTCALKRAGKGNAAAVAELKAKAERHAQDVLPIVDDIKAAGISTLLGIAAQLTERGILTARRRQWYPTTVRNLLRRSGRLL
jgi:hypothetical protein